MVIIISRKSYIRTEEHRRKNSEKAKANWTKLDSPYNRLEQAKRLKEINNKMWKDPNSRVNSKEYREKLSKSKMNIPNSEETKQILREKAIAKWKDPNSKYNSIKYRELQKYIRNDPNSIFGTKEYKQKLSIAITGNKHSEEGRKNHRLVAIKNRERTSSTMKKLWKDPNSTFNSPAYIEKMTKAMKSRNSKIELKIKEILNKLNISYEFQKRINPYYADFFIPECNLVIEADGTYSHGDPRKYKSNDLIIDGKFAKDKWNLDKKKNEFLQSLGYKVLRFWEKEINQEPELVKNLIQVAIIKNS